jgi:hypothetical protein
MIRLRRRNGQSLLELSVGLMVAVPIMLLLIDCAMIALGASTNDAVCRDAARAAASGPPGQLLASTNRTVPSVEPPNQRAVAVVKRVYQSNLPLKLRETVNVVETVNGPVPAAPLGGPVSGKVAVQTTVDVYPPFLVGAFVGSGGLVFQSRHSYPYTYVVPNTTP